jgi:Ni/Co efflux regulator RcnB
MTHDYFRFTAIVVATTLAGAGCAAAQTYHHGDSTATIHQSDASESELRRYSHGQDIITRDGNSTDITIQREEHFSPPEHRPPEYRPPEYNERYRDDDNDDVYRDIVAERFSRIDPDARNDVDGSIDVDVDVDIDIHGEDEFRQRMTERMRGDFSY